MGGKQSRVETSDVHTELRAEGDGEGPVKTTISITPALRDQIQDLQNGGTGAPAVAMPQLTPEQEAVLKDQLRQAYLKGAEDYKKKAETEQKCSTLTDSAKHAQFAKEQEAREDARVQQLVKEINQKKYRAPLNDVQCSAEREKCLQCYRDKQSDILKCREVADAFIRCAQQTTEQFVKEN
ncbi:hypothetical protein Poli38472_008742 [Pythium oligandrum]|uniref:Uncharacterized protein n=1 Tax=Pythium oligandrum TaxID=41045 RepID=A0A8K1C403_PYTOL|nr:hypothetical protein Poli38472_008742 [Pythium oligandrum]|eukprot:TMW56094.1 hypothetical protein Poli38472_008742 [Pythium oligandrum]